MSGAGNAAGAAGGAAGRRSSASSGGARDRSAERRLEALGAEISDCRRCPRLVQWRERVARERRAAFADQQYWGRPLPGFGDPGARVALLGLAPAAHGGNRTGRVFTGDRSGDFLFAALWRTGFANQPTSVGAEDGLRLRDAWVTAAVRCAPPANRPTSIERDRCLPWSAQELALLERLRVIVCLGAFAWDAALRLCVAPAIGGDGRRERPAAAVAGSGRRRARPRFSHGAEHPGEPFSLLACFHPSQQNTFTGRLTAPMLDAVLLRARELGGAGPPPVRRAHGRA